MQRRSEAKRDTGNSKTGPAPEVFAFLNSARVSKRPIEFRKRQTLFSQGEPGNHVFYIKEGSIKVAVTSTAGKKAVVTTLGPGDFLGEACLAGHPQWIATEVETAKRGIALFLDVKVCHREQSQHRESFYDSLLQGTSEDVIKVILTNG
jgi:CRP-like cAMP-binding protein